MITRRKFELLIQDLWKLLRAPDRPERGQALRLAACNTFVFAEELSREVAKLRQLTEFTCALRASDAPSRQNVEDRLMNCLTYVAELCQERVAERGDQQRPAFPAPHEIPPDLQSTREVVRVLHEFALACFEFKRLRDAFGGRRRALAFELLMPVGLLVDLRDAVAKALLALRKPQSVEARQAAEFLGDYFRERGESPDDATTEELLSLAEQTNSRSIAVGALNALVEANTISEEEALARMDDWKHKRR